jgi:hypothetical protein
MHHVKMRPVGPPPKVQCWNCARPVEVQKHNRAARYLYRGEQPATVIVEDWISCECGAYQNVRRLNEIVVDVLARGGDAAS